MKRPTSELELADIVAGASEPLRIVGGGTRGVVEGNLSVAGISGVQLYEPGALTLVARVGTPVAEVEALLAGERQRLAFEPMDHRALLGTTGEPTLGGMVAGNVSGPRRVQVGACRDSLIGVRFVDGLARVIKNGGRVMKNVTGYDLVKLMAGSFGSLGVLSEVSFKVWPMPEAVETLVCDGLEAVQAVAALSAALGSPYEVTGAAHLAVEGAQTRVRIEGMAESVVYRRRRLLELLGQGWRVETGDLWQEVRDVLPFAGRKGAVWRVSVKPSDAPALVAGLGAVPAIYDWGGGLVWMLLPDQGDCGLRAAVAALGGHATRVRGTADVARFQPEPLALAALSAGLRAKFDPRGILNPGVMG